MAVLPLLSATVKYIDCGSKTCRATATYVAGIEKEHGAIDWQYTPCSKYPFVLGVDFQKTQCPFYIPPLFESVVLMMPSKSGYLVVIAISPTASAASQRASLNHMAHTLFQLLTGGRVHQTGKDFTPT